MKTLKKFKKGNSEYPPKVLQVPSINKTKGTLVHERGWRLLDGVEATAWMVHSPCVS